MSSLKRKKDDWDDGRVIAPMDNVDSPFGRGRRRNADNKTDVSKKERRAMIRAMFSVLLPRLLIVLLSFGFIAVLMYLWLA